MRRLYLALALLAAVCEGCTPPKRFYPVEGALAVHVEKIERTKDGMMTLAWKPPLESDWYCPGFEWYERSGTLYVRFVRYPVGYTLERPFEDVPLRNYQAMPVLLTDEDGHTREIWHHIVP